MGRIARFFRTVSAKVYPIFRRTGRPLFRILTESKVGPDFEPLHWRMGERRAKRAPRNGDGWPADR